MPRLRESFADPTRFLLGAELVTTRGTLQQTEGKQMVAFAEALAGDARVDWVSITDNPGGNPMISPGIIARRLSHHGKNVVVHLTCKDANRNGLESTLWQYAADGIDNILVLSGDFPINGWQGLSQPVFDIDSVGLLQMTAQMNAGLRIAGRKPGTINELEKTDFFLGCAVSPFKLTEAEQVLQYEKLRAKIGAGAQFIVPQLGYDIRKSHELICWLRENHFPLPTVGNIYYLTPGVARVFNKGLIPGCVVSDALLDRLDREKNSADKGRAFCVDFAARQYAAFKGMGYRGAYIGGVEKHELFDAIITKAKEYETADWRSYVGELTNPRPREFYLYAGAPDGLADAARPNPVLASGTSTRWGKQVSSLYRFSRLLHALVFDYQHAPFFGFARWFYGLIQKRAGLGEFLYFGERLSKGALFECRECGDCSLPDITYLCPQSQCAKNQRNGPCGGSNNDECEVTQPGKQCIWVRAYARHRHFREPFDLAGRPVIIKNNSLNGTSGWANAFLLRDHNAWQWDQHPVGRKP